MFLSLVLSLRILGPSYLLSIALFLFFFYNLYPYLSIFLSFWLGLLLQMIDKDEDCSLPSLGEKAKCDQCWGEGGSGAWVGVGPGWEGGLLIVGVGFHQV